MKKFKYLLFMFVFSLLLVGCTEKQIILVPQINYYPVFPINEFKESKTITLNIWTQEKIINKVPIKEIVMTEVDFLRYAKDILELRSNYNLLLNNVIEFNEEINKRNIEQDEQEPQLVKDIDEESLK